MNSTESTIHVRLVTDVVTLAQCYPVVAQLRPHLTETDFLSQVERQRTNGYEVAAGFDGQRVLSFAGFRVYETLVSGRHMYVDDLITDSACRSAGCGAAMMAWLLARAREAGCQMFELDSGTHRHDAHRFYFRERMHIVGFHFRRKLIG